MAQEDRRQRIVELAPLMNELRVDSEWMEYDMERLERPIPTIKAPIPEKFTWN